MSEETMRRLRWVARNAPDERAQAEARDLLETAAFGYVSSSDIMALVNRWCPP